jgi:hypothetical protein
MSSDQSSAEGTLMKRIREVLRNEYIGAIAIGVTLASGISSLISGVIQAIAFYLDFRQKPTSVFGLPQYRIFPWGELLAKLVPFALYLLAAYLLFRWLYPGPKAKPPLKSDQDELDFAAKDESES